MYFVLHYLMPLEINGEEAEGMSRRKYLLATGGAGITGLAGCLGGDDSSGATGGDTGSSETAESDTAHEFDEFDPQNPFESLPQPTSVLFDNNFQYGTREDFEQMEPRDEAAHGDLPEDPDSADEYLEPDVLQYTWGAGEDSIQIYSDALVPLMENIEAETGLEVEYQAVDSHEAQLEAMRSERLHVARTGVGNTPFMVNLAGAVPMAMHVGAETAGYRTWTIARADNNDINEVTDLIEHADIVAHKDRTSNSGHFAPLTFMRDYDIEPGEDYEMAFPGQHEDAARGVLFGDYDAAHVAARSYGRIVPDEIDPSELKAVWASPPHPEGPTCYRYNLHPDIVEGIERAHFEYDYSGTSIEEDVGAVEYIEFDYATHFHNVMRFQDTADVEYIDE